MWECVSSVNKHLRLEARCKLMSHTSVIDFASPVLRVFEWWAFFVNESEGLRTVRKHKGECVYCKIDLLTRSMFSGDRTIPRISSLVCKSLLHVQELFIHKKNGFSVQNSIPKRNSVTSTQRTLHCNDRLVFGKICHGDRNVLLFRLPQLRH